LTGFFYILTGNLPALLVGLALASATVFLVILAVTHASLERAGGLLDSGLENMGRFYERQRLLKQVKRYTGTISVKMSFAEKMELKFIDGSNIRKYIPFFNLNMLVIACVPIFFAAFAQAYKLLRSPVSSAVISALFSSSPFLALDVLGRYNSEKVRRMLANFVSVLNRWCAVKEDIFYAFEKSLGSGIGEPLKTYVRDMVIQVKKGLDPQEALDLLGMKVDSAQFHDFIVNVAQNIRHRGDIRRLLSNLEDEFYMLEEEYSRRKISTYRDRLLIYACMLSVLVFSYLFFRFNPAAMAFYLETEPGRLLLVLFTFVYCIAFVLSLGISRFNY